MTALSRAKVAWGDPPPDWVAALAEACDRESQAKVARRLQYSAAVVSGTINGTYKGDLRAVEGRVRDVLMRATVGCPVLGDIPSTRCVEEQAAPFRATNHQRVQLYHACRGGCPHSRIGGER